jgi:hypothetical protein
MSQHVFQDDWPGRGAVSNGNSQVYPPLLPRNLIMAKRTDREKSLVVKGESLEEE